MLPCTLEAIRVQTYQPVTVVVCVNQPDSWWDEPEHVKACRNNLKIMETLRAMEELSVEVIDRASPGMGWTGKQRGVGWARKLVMDRISGIASPDDIILSLDADTTFPPEYFQEVADGFARFPEAYGLSAPYVHPIPADPEAAHAMLRYEIYLRYYLLNLFRIENPYAFTPLGSAMACPVWAYRTVRGITPKHSGEDFYFLQKLRKAGPLLHWIPSRVYPASRFSARVNFGTGPAMIEIRKGHGWRYPLFPFEGFDEIREACERFPYMMSHTPDLPVFRFLAKQLREQDPFQAIRENFREAGTFVRACHEKLDGLRILQYQKDRYALQPLSDEESFIGWLRAYYPDQVSGLTGGDDRFSFAGASIEDLDRIRKFLLAREDEYRIRTIPWLPGRRPPEG